jgi:hypothetical protein
MPFSSILFIFKPLIAHWILFILQNSCFSEKSGSNDQLRWGILRRHLRILPTKPLFTTEPQKTCNSLIYPGPRRKKESTRCGNGVFILLHFKCLKIKLYFNLKKLSSFQYAKELHRAFNDILLHLHQYGPNTAFYSLHKRTNIFTLHQLLAKGCFRVEH